MEATATWAEDELYDDVNDNRQYLAESPLAQPHQSMDQLRRDCASTATGSSSATSPSGSPQADGELPDGGSRDLGARGRLVRRPRRLLDPGRRPHAGAARHPAASGLGQVRRRQPATGRDVRRGLGDRVRSGAARGPGHAVAGAGAASTAPRGRPPRQRDHAHQPRGRAVAPASCGCASTCRTSAAAPARWRRCTGPPGTPEHHDRAVRSAATRPPRSTSGPTSAGSRSPSPTRASTTGAGVPPRPASPAAADRRTTT